MARDHAAVDAAMNRMAAGVPCSDQSLLMSCMGSLEIDYVYSLVFLWAPIEKGPQEGFGYYVKEMYCVWKQQDCDELLLVDITWCEA